MTDEFFRTHLKADLLSLYMTPTTYKFRFSQERKFDHYVAYAPKNLNNYLYGEINAFASSNFNLSFQNQLNMILTRKPMILLRLLLLKYSSTKHTNFFSNQNTHIFHISKQPQIYFTILASISLFFRSTL